MRLATLAKAGRDGTLVIVSPNGAACALAPAATLQDVMENWDAVAPQIAAIPHFNLPLADLAAPLPRAWQWLDGSAFSSHGDLMEKVDL